VQVLPILTQQVRNHLVVDLQVTRTDHECSLGREN
jgi:hypothetical protein